MTDKVNFPPISGTPVKVLFVCLGNICRSPAAEGVFRHLFEQKGLEHHYVIDSAGTYGGHAGDLPDQRMRVHAIRRGYNLTHRSRRITSGEIEDWDVIVAMDKNNIYALQSLCATVEETRKIVPMAAFLRCHPHNDYVPDPYYEGSQGFELVLDLLEDACAGLLDYIENAILES